MKSLRFLSVVLLFVFSLSSVFGANEPERIALPDFAYPQDALKTAELLLKSKEGDKRILGSMEYSHANKLIDRKSLPATMKYIEQLAAKETNPAVKSLLLLLAANVGTDFNYNSSLCKVYSPEAKTLEEAITNLELSIDSLMEKAVEIAPETPLKNFYNVFDWSEIGLSILPTVRDFVAYDIVSTERNKSEMALRFTKKDSPAYYAIKANYYSFLRLDSIKPLIGNRNADYAVYSFLKDRRPSRNIGEDKEFIQFYDFLLSAKDKCKGSWVEETVDSVIDYFNTPYYILKLNKIGPRQIELKLKTYNLKENKVTIYRFLTEESAYEAVFMGKLSEGKVVFEKSFTGTPTPLGETFIDTLNFEPGHYIASCSNISIQPDRHYSDVLTLSPLKELELSESPDKGVRKIQLLNNVTGQPATDVSIILFNRDNDKTSPLRADNNGCFTVPNSDSFTNLKYIDKRTGVELISNEYIYRSRNKSQKNIKKTEYSVTPDLPIYRPGDTARLTLVVTKGNQTVEGAKLNAKLLLPSPQNSRNNNLSERSIDVTFSETDEFGRSTAEVVIPEDSPLGSARIVEKKSHNFLGRINLTEFKLNDLKISDVKYKYTTDSIVVTGSTVNTAGVPVGNVTISGKVNFYVGDNNIPDVEIDTVSNERGAFEFSFPRYWSANTKIVEEENDDDIVDEDGVDLLYANDDERYSASIDIEAESPNGQNTSFSKSVDMEYPNKISFSTHSLINKNKGINVKVNITGSNPPEEYIWKISTLKETKALATGTAKGVLNLNTSVLKAVEPEIYKLIVELPDSSARPYSENITIYDLSSPNIPTDKPFLLTETQITTQDNKLEIGVKEDDTYVWIYYGYFKKDSKTPSMKVIGHKLKKGWHRLPIDFGFWSETYNHGSVDVYALQNDERYINKVTVEPVRKSELTLTCETFRDNVSADSRQTWQFVTRLKNKPVSAAVYLNIMNSKLLPFGPISTPSVSRFYKYFNLNVQSLGWQRSSVILSGETEPLYIKPEVLLPTWRQFTSSTGIRDLNGIRIRGVGSMNSSYSDADVLKESVMREAPEESAVEGPLKGKVAGIQTMSSVATDVEYDVESPSMKKNYSTTAASTGLYGYRTAEGNIEDLFDYNPGDGFIRDPKVYTALWAPMLTTNSDGIVEVSFLVPGETTEWTVSARAWTRDLYTATLKHQFSATRQLIVAPNPPRFVRVSDRVNLVMAVTNNTDSTKTVKASVSVKADSVSLVDNNSSITIEPRATNYLTTPVSVDVTGGELEYTVRVTDGVTGDGERNIIPVLTSSALVTESRNFYINPGQKDFSTSLPSPEGSDFVSELHYTTNPMWTVVESLPKAIEPWCEAASAVAMSVYTSRTALALSEKFTDAKDVIDLTDAKKYADEGLKKLKKMQTSEGGFKWAEWADKADRFSTLIVLDWLSSEADDPEVAKLVKQALDYVDRTAVGKDGKVYPDFYYTVVRSFYGLPNDQNGSRVVNMTINEMQNRWKSYSLDQKALAAIALKNYGYEKTAQTILGSLRQFGRLTADRGFEFPNMPNIIAYTHTLDAFASVEPKADIVNGIVQHLLYIRQGMDWGSSSLTSYAVRSIMNAASTWVVKPSPVRVTVDGNPVETHQEGNTGAITTGVKGRQLTINRSVSDYPAYGAVVSTYVASLSNIKPFSDGEVEITKTFVRVDKDGKETQLGTDASVNPGEKLSVVLLVTAKRPLTNIVVTDMRPAAFEPVVQVPRMIWNYRSTPFYLENRDAVTNIYVGYIPAGTSQFTYEVTVNNTGTFTTGQATVASAIAPDLTAHSGSTPLILKTK